MAKALRTIAVVAGAVALVATGIGAVGGAAFAATALGGTIASIATWAGVVAGVAGIGAQLLTKPPPARGSVTETIIEVDPPSPYGMGEGYFAGIMRHRVGYGPTTKKVPNPYLFEALALCVAGPIAGPITPQVDFGPVSSYYAGWLATDVRLGNRPDTALGAPLFPNPPGWGPNHRLSGVACASWGHRFDKDGKVYASGLPTRGFVAKWVKVYDPRKDSTRPGGSGPHRLGIEATYEWSENPALHAGTYAHGRYVNGERVIGVGLPGVGIDWEGISAWANDCDANGWRMFGFVFEGAEDDAQRRWQNLRDICIAGGGEPLFSGAILGFHWNRPRVPLDTVTEADLAEGPQEVTAMKSWRDRLNTVRPRYTSPDHNWSLVQAQQVQVASYLAEDGEQRAEEIPFNFVKDKDQAAQLAAYWLTNSREISPITLTLMPRLSGYRPGECLRLELPELGLDHDAVILQREFNPADMTVTLTLVTEDPGKHPFALGRTGVAPPTPSLTNTAADRDEITRAARAPFWPEVDGPGRPEDGANVTETRIAAGITGQAPAATDPTIQTGATRGAPAGTLVAGVDAAALVADAATAKADAATALTALGNIANDGVFAVNEKIQVRQLRNDIVIEFPVWRDRAVNLGVAIGLRTAYQTAYDQLIAYLASVAIDTNANTSVTRSTFTARFNAYFSTRSALIDAITNRATQIATSLPLGNANRVPFSQMEGDRGWQPLTNPAGIATSFAYGQVGGFRLVIRAGAATAAGQTISLGQVPNAFRVTPGERLSAQGRVDFQGPGAGTWTLGLEFWNSDFSAVSGADIANGSAPSLVNVVRQAFFTVPADRVWARFVLFGNSGGAGDMQLVLSEPMVTSAAPEQTVHPAFTPGPNSFNAADVTAANTSAFVAGQGPFATSPLPTSRLNLLNDAGRSTSRRLNSQIMASGIFQTINTNPITATTSGGVSTITINPHDVFDDAGTLSFSGASIGGLAPSTTYYVWESNPDFVGGARSYVATTNRNDVTAFGRRFVGFVTTPATAASPPAGGGGGGGGGWGGGGDIP